MTAKAQGKIWDSELPHEWKYICVALADQSDDDGLCVYRDTSYRYLCKKTGLSESTVRRRIQEMLDADAGVLIITRPATQHRGPEYRIMFDVIKNGDEEHWKQVMDSVSRRAKKAVQGCQRDTSGAKSRGVNGTVQGCQRDAQGCQRDAQGCQRDGSHIRFLDSPGTKDSPNTHKGAGAREEAGSPEGEEANQTDTDEHGQALTGPDTTCLGDHEFELFWSNGPWSKIPGWEVHKPAALVEFLRSPGRWRMWQRAAQLYGVSADVQRFVEDGGRGVKYPQNFIRGSTWMGYLQEQVVESEGQALARKAKTLLEKALETSPDKMPGDLDEDAKRLFRSLNTHWQFLARMRQEGLDICGPQTAHLKDAQMLRAGS